MTGSGMFLPGQLASLPVSGESRTAAVGGRRSSGPLPYRVTCGVVLRAGPAASAQVTLLRPQPSWTRADGNPGTWPTLTATANDTSSRLRSHHVRPERVRLRRPAGGRQRVPGQVRHGRRAAGRHPGGRVRRGAAGHRFTRRLIATLTQQVRAGLERAARAGGHHRAGT